MERELTHFEQFSLFHFSTRTFLTVELAILKSEFRCIQILLFGFSSLKLQTSFEFASAKLLTNILSKTASKVMVQKLRNKNVFMSHMFFSSLIDDYESIYLGNKMNPTFISKLKTYNLVLLSVSKMNPTIIS